MKSSNIGKNFIKIRKIEKKIQIIIKFKHYRVFSKISQGRSEN